MQYADECVRLAALTDQMTVRDQLVELAQSWLVAARQTESAQVITLYPKPLGDG